MGDLYWRRIIPQPIDAVGVSSGVRTFALGGALPSHALRRSIGSVGVEASNPDPDFVNQFGAWGLNLALWVRDVAEPPPVVPNWGVTGDYGDEVLHWEWAPGEQYRTTATGVPIFRFPSGGGAIQIDTPSSRLGLVGGGGWRLYLIWALNIPVGSGFDASVLNVKVNFSSATLWEAL